MASDRELLESAIANLGDAVTALDRIPVGSTIGAIAAHRRSVKSLGRLSDDLHALVDLTEPANHDDPN